jgi:hypothetical protein
MDIKNTTQPFEIHIPRQKNTLPPSIIYQNISLLSNDSEFKYYYVNLTHNLNLSISLHIDIEPQDLQLSYLFIIRFNGKPYLNTNSFDHSKLICPQGNLYF